MPLSTQPQIPPVPRADDDANPPAGSLLSPTIEAPPNALSQQPTIDDPAGAGAARRPDSGRIVAGYEILEELGRGGMGVVYKARQVGLKRLVALKMILAGDHAAPNQRERFRLEAEAVARLQHPNIVQIHEVGEQDGKPYFSLEYVDGGSLQEKLAGVPWPARAAARMVETLARAMHLAHEQGIVHRDLKPANVLLTADGTPKISDFGLAKQLETDSGQTQSGQIVGTPRYMAPEQAAGNIKAISPASDTYALGTILYEMLTGRPPFQAATMLDTLCQVQKQEPVPPLREHAEAVEELAAFFLAKWNVEYHRNVGLSEAALRKLQTFSWPGNVRELRSVLETAVATAEGELIHAGDLRLMTPDDAPSEGPASLNIEELEAWAIRQAVKRTNGNNTKAAEVLGINRDTLIKKMKKFGINRKE